MVVQSLNVKTGATRLLTDPDSGIKLAKYRRLSPSADGRWIAYPQVEGQGEDLILVEDD